MEESSEVINNIHKKYTVSLSGTFASQKVCIQGHPTTVFSRILLNAVLGYLEYF